MRSKEHKELVKKAKAAIHKVFKDKKTPKEDCVKSLEDLKDYIELEIQALY